MPASPTTTVAVPRSEITIYHNPKCSTSRNVLALIRNTGGEPEIVEYLKTPPTREKLMALISQMNVPVREIIRRKEALYDELALNNSALGDDALVDAMLAHPILMNRPIVETTLGTRLCRPQELVFEILPQQDTLAEGGCEVARDDQEGRVTNR